MWYVVKSNYLLLFELSDVIVGGFVEVGDDLLVLRLLLAGLLLKAVAGVTQLLLAVVQVLGQSSYLTWCK
jgi:hypothetical protein